MLKMSKNEAHYELCLTNDTRIEVVTMPHEKDVEYAEYNETTRMVLQYKCIVNCAQTYLRYQIFPATKTFMDIVPRLQG